MYEVEHRKAEPNIPATDIIVRKVLLILINGGKQTVALSTAMKHINKRKKWIIKKGLTSSYGAIYCVNYDC